MSIHKAKSDENIVISRNVEAYLLCYFCIKTLCIVQKSATEIAIIIVTIKGESRINHVNQCDYSGPLQVESLSSVTSI